MIISANQFKKSKDGDRFFFTHLNQEGISFNKGAITTLKSRTLAGIICDNTNILKIPSDVFHITPSKSFIYCADTPKLENISTMIDNVMVPKGKSQSLKELI